MSMIEVEGLSKSFRVAKRRAGIVGHCEAWWTRRYEL